MNTVYTSGQLGKFTDVLDGKGVVHEHFQRGLTSGSFADVADFLVSGGEYDRDAVRSALGLGPFNWPTEVDYGLDLGEMIAAGHYDWSNPDITPGRFPVAGNVWKVGYENKIFHFGRLVSSEAACDLIVAEDPHHPWEPWKTEQTLAFGAKYPDEQRKFWIAGLGPVDEFNGHRRVLVLYSRYSKRNLLLIEWDTVWRASYRFGASRRLAP